MFAFSFRDPLEGTEHAACAVVIPWKALLPANPRTAFVARLARAAILGALAAAPLTCAAVEGLPTMPGPASEDRGREFAIPSGNQGAARINRERGGSPRAASSADRTEDAAAANARCEGCHDDIAGEWRASLHKASQTHPPYARAFALEPLPFCQSCHAPEADPRAPVPEGAASIGTGCVTCHLTGDAPLAAPRAGKEEAVRGRPDAPHAVTRDARFAAAGACAGCHEFTFPEVGIRRPRELMQSTITEHRASTYASFACAECHMPVADGPRGRHRSHAFEASRSPEMIRAAASVRAARTGPTSIRVELLAGEVGHAFPTGDLFRRLKVSAEAVGDDFALVARADRVLARRFGDHRVGMASARTQIADDRAFVGASTREIHLDLGSEAAGMPIYYEVTYERVEHPVSSDGTEALIEGAISVAAGTLPP